jgi:hypothetical protein
MGRSPHPDAPQPTASNPNRPINSKPLHVKTSRRSSDRGSAASPLHLVSTWAADQQLVLAQLAVGDKSSEPAAVPKLLELLSLNRTICHCRYAELPAVDRQPDHRLCLGPKTQPADAVRRCPPLPRRSRDDGPQRQRHQRRTWPHRVPHCQLQRRHRLAAGQPLLAGHQSRRHDHRNPRNRRRNPRPDPLLHAQPSL